MDDFCCRFKMLQLDMEYSGKFGDSFWEREGASIEVIHT